MRKRKIGRLSPFLTSDTCLANLAMTYQAKTDSKKLTAMISNVNKPSLQSVESSNSIFICHLNYHILHTLNDDDDDRDPEQRC